MSKVSVRIPTPLRKYTGGADEIAADGDTVGEVLTALEDASGGILEQILTPEGQVRSFVNLYLGEYDISELEGLQSTVSDGDVISIVPAVAGGSA